MCVGVRVRSCARAVPDNMKPLHPQPRTHPIATPKTPSTEPLAATLPSQVAALLVQAQDPDRLCRMYFGWAPFL